jgi:hypothetical protein
MYIISLIYHLHLYVYVYIYTIICIYIYTVHILIPWLLKARQCLPGAPERLGGRRPSAELAQSPRGTGSGASAPRDGGSGSHLDAVC